MLWDLWNSKLPDYLWQLLSLRCTILCYLAHASVHQAQRANCCLWDNLGVASSLMWPSGVSWH